MPKSMPKSSYRKGSNKRRRASVKSAKRSGSTRTGRAVLRKSIGSRSSQYSFTRSRTDLILPWRNSAPLHDDEGSRFFLNKKDVNGDSGYYVMQMKLALRDLPAYDEFRTIFSRFKLTGWNTRITPTFSKNMQAYDPGTANDTMNPIPNLEFFIIPSTYFVHPGQHDFNDMDDDEITNLLNQTQIKARRMMPSRGFTFQTKNPKIARTGFLPGRTDGAVNETEVYMGTAPWLENGPGEGVDPTAINDQRRVMHTGYTVLCRRVDLGPMQGLAPQDSSLPPDTLGRMNAMQWRVNTQAFMKFDKVR